MKKNCTIVACLALLASMLGCRLSGSAGSPTPPEVTASLPEASLPATFAPEAGTSSLAVQPLVASNPWFNRPDNTIPLVTTVFFIRNPNPSAAIEGAQYLVTLYDSSNNSLLSQTVITPVVFPGESLPIVSTFSLMSNAGIAKMEITPQQTGKPFASSAENPFLISQQAFFPDPTEPIASGLIANNLLGTNLDSVSVTGIAYDAKGQIVGAGTSGGLFVSAGGKIGVTIGMPGVVSPASIKLFPFIEHAWGLEPASGQAEPVQVVKEGVVSSEGGGTPEYGFVIKNTDMANGRTNISYFVTAMDDKGNVVATQGGNQEIIFPEEELGFTADLEMPVNTNVANINIQIHSSSDDQDTLGIKSAGLTANPLKIEQGSFETTESGGQVTCYVENTYSKDMNEFWVVVLGFDKNGVLVNVGMDSDTMTVPADGKLAVQIPMANSQAPDDLEIFPVFTVIPIW
jgi:hypothetical protein